MRPDYYLPSPSLLLTAFVSVAVLAPPAIAQDDKKPTGDDKKPSGDDQKTVAPPPPASSSDKKPAPPATSSAKAESTPSPTPSSAPPPISSPVSSAAVSLPAVSGGTLPPLTGIGAPIPTYPPPAVPPTQNAPFMKQSSAPEGTVFIAVGAILGAFGLAILLWRAIVSLLLHRSVERAAMAQQTSDGKGGFPAPPAPFYKYTDDSTMSLSGRTSTSNARGGRRTNRGPTPSSNISQSNLFFSPTASAGNAGPGNRGSSFLPSGFYAAGSSAPGTQQAGNSINMSNLRPDSKGHYVNASAESPPFLAAHDMSTSSVNLSAPLQPGQRAPSAYLEDLLTDDPNSVPPTHPSPSVGPRR